MTVPLLAAMLRRALPGLRVLDIALAGGGLYPWWPEAMVGPGAGVALPPAERALLARFRQAGGAQPLFGQDAARDAALAAGAPEEWGGSGPRLVVGAGDPAPWLAVGAMVLTRPATAAAAERAMLILGLGGAVEQRDLLLPPGGLAAALPSLGAAARDLAGSDGEVGLRAITPRLAALTLFAPASAQEPLVLERTRLVLQEEAGRLRVLLGVLPHRALRLRLATDAALSAVFLDGAAFDPAAAFLPDAQAPTVLGLAGARLRAIEIHPA